MNTHSFSLESIPTEIIQSILRQLNLVRDVLECMLVCKRWNYIASEILWYKPNLSSMSAQSACLSFFETIEASPNTTLPYTSFIRQINFSPLSKVIGDLHLLKLHMCHRLEGLTLAGCSNLTDIGLCAITQSVGSRLTSIDLSDLFEITDTAILEISTYCSNLQNLNLSMSRFQVSVTDKGIMNLAQHCNYLRRIKLNNCINVTYLSAIELSKYCPYLVEVDFMNCTLNDKALHSIFSYSKNLRELRLSQTEYNNTIKITEAAFFDPFSVFKTFHYEQLRLADFSGINTINDTWVTILIQAAPKIRSLNLSKCFDLTDQAVLSIAKLGRHLHFLHLGHCSRITDQSVAQLATSCTRVRYLDFTYCTKISDISILAIAKHAEKLKRLGLVGCSRITDASIVALAHQKHLTECLERIHLSNCIQLNIKPIVGLLNSCVRLNHLSLSGVPSFSRHDLKEFCRSPPIIATRQQRRTFCVYSGKGIQRLKDYLNSSLSELEWVYGNEQEDSFVNAFRSLSYQNNIHDYTSGMVIQDDGQS